jgi:hypothetical protein
MCCAILMGKRLLPSTPNPKRKKKRKGKNLPLGVVTDPGGGGTGATTDPGGGGKKLLTGKTGKLQT